jgi:asparagine synthase (glutamine-hydrolysing)
MCGISGIINFNGENVKTEDIHLMMKNMKLRGPDDEGYFIDNNIGLGFVRLSILDLSEAGHQPMHSEDNRYVIIFNGEVYNYIEIRKELEGKYNFRSNSDTEVILNSYIEWGEKCLDQLNGMFAFVIYDKETKKIFGARDRFGIKPLYYYQDKDQFIFASDFPSILKVMPIQPTQDDVVIMNYLLTNRTNYSKDTFFKEIKRIEHGNSFTIEDNQVTIKNWYDIEKSQLSEHFDSSKDYYQELKRSINIQLRSDVPVGVCLSGGLDSSSITSLILKEFNSDNLNSYSSVFEKGDKGDESEYIELYKKEQLKMHFTKPTAISLKKDLEDFVDTLCEPVPDTSIYSAYKVMELAKEHSTVVLNGQGADEVLGGYDYFYGAYLKELLIHFKWGKFLKHLISLKRFNGLMINLKYLLFFLSPKKTKLKILLKRNNFVSKDYYNKYKEESHKLIENFYQFKTVNEFYKKHLKYKFEHLLIWADKLGMRFSLETRFPFIDHLLIEKTLNTNQEDILKHGWTKSILRESFQGILFDEIRMRRLKVGFETPEKNWFKSEELKPLLLDVFQSESFKKRPYFEKGKIMKLYQDHIDGKEDNSTIIWKAFHLELWFRRFIDNKY